MKKNAIIVGAFHEIVELAEESDINIVGFIDNSKDGIYLSYPILSNDFNAANLLSIYRDIPLIVTPDKPAVRSSLNSFYEGLGFTFISLISNCAKISKSASIDIGSIIQHNVNISSKVIIGKFAKLNTACNVMHDSIIGDFTTIAPNAVVLGYSYIGRHCYIGSNATILPSLNICDNLIIG